MFLIKFTNEGAEQRVQYGFTEQPLVDLATAFDRIGDYILTLPDVDATLPIGEADPAWTDLVFDADTILDLRIEAYRGGFLLVISEAYTGSDTSVGIDSLAQAFDFTVRWCGNVREVQPA